MSAIEQITASVRHDPEVSTLWFLGDDDEVRVSLDGQHVALKALPSDVQQLLLGKVERQKREIERAFPSGYDDAIDAWLGRQRERYEETERWWRDGRPFPLCVRRGKPGRSACMERFAWYLVGMQLPRENLAMLVEEAGGNVTVYLRERMASADALGHLNKAWNSGLFDRGDAALKYVRDIVVEEHFAREE